jgi:hypothetical protein
VGLWNPYVFHDKLNNEVRHPELKYVKQSKSLSIINFGCIVELYNKNHYYDGGEQDDTFSLRVAEGKDNLRMVRKSRRTLL